jgi:hypothetical protein
VGIPIMIQDAPASGTVLSAAFLARMAREIEHVAYFKIETAGAASKLRELIRLGGDAIEGPWDGEEAITLLPDLDAGATGSMTGGGYPDGIRPIIEAHRAGDREKAFSRYQQWLPLINYENRQAGLLACQGADEGRRRDRLRRPALNPDTRAMRAAGCMNRSVLQRAGAGMGAGIGSMGAIGIIGAIAGAGTREGAGMGAGIAAGAGMTTVVTDSRITPPPITLPSTLPLVLPLPPSTRASQSARSGGGCKPQRARALRW